MDATIRDFHDLVRILEEHPQWRGQLRRLVLTEELLRLPEELASFRAETERRLARLEEALIGLTARVDALTARVDELAKAQRRTEERLETLTARVDKLAQVQEGVLVDLGHLKGRDKEREFRERAPAYFGRYLSGLRVFSPAELARKLEPALEQGQLSLEEYQQVLEADVVARGRMRSTGEEVYLVVEVSWGAGLGDLERAVQRAGYLGRTGRRALPAIGGQEVFPQVEKEAVAKGVVVAADGRILWPE
ncbi:MAG: hypothetical protein ACUVWR_17275 [Anaerolineae bacterium]